MNKEVVEPQHEPQHERLPLMLRLMLFPYFVYVAHFKKFTYESFLFKEKSLLVKNHMRKKVVGEKDKKLKQA